LNERISAFVSLPLDSLYQLAVEDKLRAIGEMSGTRGVGNLDDN